MLRSQICLKKKKQIFSSQWILDRWMPNLFHKPVLPPLAHNHFQMCAGKQHITEGRRGAVLRGAEDKKHIRKMPDGAKELFNSLLYYLSWQGGYVAVLCCQTMPYALGLRAVLCERKRLGCDLLLL